MQPCGCRATADSSASLRNDNKGGIFELSFRSEAKKSAVLVWINGCEHLSFSGFNQAAGSGLDQAVAPLPLLLQAGPDGFDLGALAIAGSGPGGEAGRPRLLASSSRSRSRSETGDAQVGKASLAGAEELARDRAGRRSISASSKPSWCVDR